MKNTLLVFSFFFLLIFAQTNFAAGSVDSTFNASVTEGLGNVNRTLTQPDGKIIAFGSFQRANGLRFNNIVRFNADGTLDPTFNPGGSGANNFVAVAVLQSDNKIIIGGNFTDYNGVTINRVARLNTDGSFDSSFAPAANFTNFVDDIVIQPDGKIIAAARLAGSPPSSRIVRLNNDGSIDPAFQSNLTANGYVNSIAYSADGKILLGGEFTIIGGVSKPFLARLNSDGTVDNAFSTPLNDTINKVVIQPDGKLLLGGSSFVFGAERLNADGSSIAPVSKPAVPSVIVYSGYDVALLPDGKILVAYGFGSGSISSYMIHRLNADLTMDSSFQTTTPDYLPVRDINLLSNGKFIGSGDFVSINNQPRVYIGRFNADGSVDSAFGAAISSIGSVRTIKRQTDGKLLIGGIFENVNGVRRTNIARLNPDGTLDTSFNVPSNLFNFLPNYVYDIELQADGKIIVGRYMFLGNSPARSESLGSYSTGGVIRLNPDGSLDESFMTIATGLMLSLNVAPDNSIFIGGLFDNLQVPPYGTGTFCKLLPNGDLDTVFYPSQQPLGAIYEIVTQADGKLLVSGTFLTVGGTPRPGTARYNTNGTLDTSYTGVLRNVYALGLANDGKIYAGGNFPISGGNPNQNLARLMPYGSIDPTFVGTANAPVRDLIVQPNGKVIIGGEFTNYYSNPVGRLARVNPNGSFDPTFNTGAGASGNIYALEKQADGKLLVGGQFSDFDGTEKFSLVRLKNVNPSVPFDFDGDTKSDLSIFRSNVGEWWYQRSSDAQVAAAQFGSGTDKIVPADFSGDGRADIAVWRPSTGEWFILRSEDSSFYSVPFGTTGDIPAPGDFDGDGRSDITVFRPSSGTWFISKSSGGTAILNFGQAGDVPAVGDYDGDGKADTAIFRPSNGNWWLNRSTAGVVAATFGTSTDKPVQGDYTGDGKTDIAFYRPSNGEWFILRSDDASFFSVPFGTNGDIPTAGDYDGDGKFDFAVFRPTGATWYVYRSTTGLLIQQFGLSSDTPVPSAFLP